MHEGEPPIVMGVCVNIDSLKHAEQEKSHLLRALTQERARFANILEQLLSGVVLAEAHSGKLTYQNQAASIMLGRGIEHVDSVDDDVSYRFTDACGAPLAADQLPLARTVRHAEPAQMAELVYHRDDGARVHLAITSAAITDADGVARVAVAVLHDVTDLNRVEWLASSERERALVTLAAITDGVITADRRGRLLSLNPAAERMLGMLAEELRGATFLEALQFEETGGR